MPNIRQIFLSLGVSVLSLSITSCAHTSEQEEKEKTQQREMDVVKERVRRLERKISDLDTKLTLLLDRGNDEVAPKRVSLGPARAAAPFYSPHTSSPHTLSPPSGTNVGVGGSDSPAHDDWSSPPIAVGPGARPIDLPQAEPTQIWDPDPSEPLVVGDEPDDGPVLLDKAALARLTANDRKEPPPNSRTPNRKISRQDTRPGPQKRGRAARANVDHDPGSAKATTRNAMPVKSAKKLYAWAMSRKKESNFAQAIGAFDELKRRYPKHHLADNALYWIGVCHQSRGANADALAAWRRLPMQYPKSPKLPDALFGMAQVHEMLNDKRAAVELYGQLIDQYPRAERSQQARVALARLRGG